jgi:hypothetical protein
MILDHASREILLDDEVGLLIRSKSPKAGKFMLAFHFRRYSFFSLVFLLSIFHGATAFAQDYPTRPIYLVVGYPPGGAPSISSRA